MSQKPGKAPEAPAAAKGGDINVLDRCKFEACKQKTTKMSFCAEHYEWFKFGMITREGKKPVDFDKKMMAYQKHHGKVKAS